MMKRDYAQLRHERKKGPIGNEQYGGKQRGEKKKTVIVGLVR